MKTSKNGIELIKKFEGCRLTAYKPVITEKYWTIGYGHYGADVKQGMRITHAQAEAYLRADLVKFETSVNALSLPLNQNQFDALTSFTYNCGSGNLKKLVKGRNLREIADALLLYNKAGGKELKGLTKRRKEERNLFLKGYVVTVNNNDYTEIAYEVIDGKWGNGADRKRRLTEAGYNYPQVQSLVNKLITGG